MDTRPVQQPESCGAAGARAGAQADAGLTGSVAGLTAARLWVAVEARPAFPHTAAV